MPKCELNLKIKQLYTVLLREHMSLQHATAASVRVPDNYWYINTETYCALGSKELA